MPTADIRTPDGNVLRSIELDAAIFGIEPNVPVMHQVVTAQLAAARSGTHSTKTRAEVRGGGKKPWRQKGTGRARQGSTRAPHWAGGGVAMGPKPRDYRQKTPKKMVQLALRSALSDRASEGRIAVVERWQFDAPSTKKAKAALTGLGIAGKVLVVLGAEESEVARSFRNLPEAHIILASELNAYDVLCSDWVLFSEATLPGGEPVTPTAKPATAKTTTPAAATPETPESPAVSEAPAGEAPEDEGKWDAVVQGTSPAAVVAEAELETAAPTEPVEAEGDDAE